MIILCCVPPRSSAIREIVAEQLDFAVTDIRQAQRIWFGQKQPSSLSGETYTWHTVAIKTAAGTAYRRIPLTAGDLAVITERLEANDEYGAAPPGRKRPAGIGFGTG